MAGSSNQFTYGLGATSLAIPALSVVKVNPPDKCIGYYFGYQSGGSLSIMNSAGASGGLGGMLLSTTERLNIDGPAQFYLAATGATAVATLVFKFSSAISPLP